MPQDSSQVRIGGNGQIRVAPKGTAAPADIVAAWPAGWIDIGLATPEGVRVQDSKELLVVPAWQQFYPVRRAIQSRNFRVAFDLLQWSADTVKLAFGGGTITTPAGGGKRYAPPSAETVDERSLGIEWTDGTIKNRLILPVALAVETGEIPLRRTNPAALSITMEVIGQATGDPWYILTDDPAIA